MEEKDKDPKEKRKQKVMKPNGSPDIIVDTDRLSPEVTRIIEFVRGRVIGQDRATEHVVRLLNILFAGLHEEDEKPIGQLFLAGPTGSGKTLTAKEVARGWFGESSFAKYPLTPVQCNRFQEQHGIASFIGSPPGYVGHGEGTIFSQVNLEKYYFFIAFEKLIKDIEKEQAEGKDTPTLEKVLRAYPAIFASSKRLRDADEGNPGKSVVDTLRAFLAQLKEMLKALGRDRGISHMRGGQAQEILGTLNTVFDRFKEHIGPLYSIVLFDEIEKAHPNIWEMLLGIFQEGKLQLATGEETDFRHTLFFLTTNTGSKEIQAIGSRKIGFNTGEARDSLQVDEAIYQEGKKAIEKMFQPEFVGRIKEEIIVFRALTRQDLTQILEIFLTDVKKAFDGSKERSRVPPLLLSFSDEFTQFLLDKGEAVKYGARELEGVVKKYVRAKLAAAVSSGELEAGDVVHFDMRKGQSVVYRSRRPDEE